MRNLPTSRKHFSKTRRLACLSLALAAGAGLYSIAWGKQISNADGEYLRDRWGSERGYPGGTISAIAQSSDGYLWLGTEKGLIRFDGLNFRVFQQAGPTAVPIGPVQSLLSDADGTMWVLLQSTKILRYHDGQFEAGRGEVEFGVTALAPGANHSVLVSSLALGPLRYREGKFLVLASATGEPNSPISPNPETTRSQNLPENWSTGVATHRIAAPNSPVIAMAETSDGRIWLATRDKGLFAVQDGRISPVTGPQKLSSTAPMAVDLAAIKINCLLPLENGELWLGTDDGLVRWNGSALTREAVPGALRHQRIVSILRDRDANSWLGTAHGLLRLNSEGLSFVDEAGANPAAQVTALFTGREGNLWLGAAQGLERFRQSIFVTYTTAEGLPSESNGPLYVDAEQRTWFAPLDGGLHWLKSGATGSIAAAGLQHDVVYSIAGNGNDLWLGRQKGGLTHLHIDDLRAGSGVVTQTYTHAEGLAQDSVFAVFQSSDGAIWAATLDRGVSQLKNGRFTTYTAADGLLSNSVTSIAEGPDGTMWFASASGLSSYANGHWQLCTARDGLLSDDLDSLFRDSQGVLWIGTAAGLSFFQSGHIASPQNMPPSLHEQIYGFAEDNNGSLWVATVNHILRVSRSQLLAGALTAADFREFGVADGLHGTEGVRRQRSVFSDSRGRIWFSTNRGLSIVDPARAARTLAPALVHIEAISADGALLDPRAVIRIPAGRQRVTVSYAGLSLSAPERVRYRYQLEGFDHAWSEPVATREAIYTNLSPGSYHFHVIACNSDGLWNEIPATLDFILLPAFYQTSWFYVLCFLAAALLASAGYVWRVRLVAHRLDLQFQERLSERTRIARELHDTLLQSFQGLTLHFQRARNLLPGRPAEAIQTLDRALDRAEQAIVESRDAILDIRSPAAVDADLAQQLTALGRELESIGASPEPAAFQVLVEGMLVPLDPLLEVEIFRIAREALRNAFSHSHARNIEAEIVYGKKQFRLRVRDDGKGIDPRIVSEGERAGHFGLLGMRERAKRIDGELDVWSEPGAGTEIELCLPGSRAYRSETVAASEPSKKSNLSNA